MQSALAADLCLVNTPRMEDSRYLIIEERLAWLERHVVEQDKAMLELSKTNDALKKQLLELRGRSHGSSAGSAEEIFEGDERPPHY